MTLRPGTWPWLLRHEMRLAWRDVGARRLKILLGLGAVLWVGLHLSLAPLFSLRAAYAMPWPNGALLAAAVLWLGLTLMLSHAIIRSVGVLFDRGDLDLLLASPLAPRNVFVVRGLGVAFSTLPVYAFLLTPFAHLGLFYGRPELVAIYPALLALGLLSAALGMAITLVLVRLLGARRARVAAQLLSAFVGAAFFLLTQAGSLLSSERTSRWLSDVMNSAQESAAVGRWSPFWLPLDAMQGKALALLAVTTVGVGSFAFVVATLARRFLDGTRESLAPAGARPAARPVVAGRFHTRLCCVVLTKEWKSIARDPQLIAQTLLETLYLLPMLLMPIASVSTATRVAPVIVMTAAMLASGLAWLTVAAEDAPELIAAAPVEPRRMRRLKIAAAVLPVWALAAPFACFTALADPYAAAVFALCVAGATIATSMVQLGLPRTGSRADLRRRAKGNALATALDFVASLGWAALAGCLLAAPRYAPLAAIPALAAPTGGMAAWPRAPPRADALLRRFGRRARYGCVPARTG